MKIKSRELLTAEATRKTIYNQINADTIVSKFDLLTVLFGMMTIISCIPACFVVISSAVI